MNQTKGETSDDVSVTVISTAEKWGDGFYNPYSSTKPDPQTLGRTPELDLARGIAIVLMILSHTIKGLLSDEMIPTWGFVPIHLITKFSSTLFFIIFGISLALFYLPYVQTSKWKGKRKRLLLRGLEVTFWYKVLIIVQLFQITSRQTIIDTLLFYRSADFVEVLGFYGVILLWIPLFLPFWQRSSWTVRSVVLGAFTLISFFGESIPFGTAIPLKALLVEQEGFYTFGQFPRGALVLVGLMLGEMISKTYSRKNGYYFLSFVFMGLSLACWFIFIFAADMGIYAHLVEIARNIGKHPPDLVFMSFSMGGAFGILGLCFLGRQPWTERLNLITIIGRNSLQAFIFHIVVIFVVYRWLLDYRHNIEYSKGLFLAALTIFLTSNWCWYLKWRKL